MIDSQQNRQDKRKKKRGTTKIAANGNTVTTGIHTATDTNGKTVPATFTTKAMATGHPKKMKCLGATTQN
jgi:hypothetical protein